MIDQLSEDIFLNVVSYVGGGPSALVRLGLTNKCLGWRLPGRDSSFVERVCGMMVCGIFCVKFILLHYLSVAMFMSHSSNDRMLPIIVN